MRVKQIVKNAGETATNTDVERQLEKQPGPRKKISPFILLKSTSDFLALDLLSMPLSVKAKKGKKKQSKEKERKTTNPWCQKMKEKPASVKPKYNCGCFDNIEKRWIEKVDVSVRDLWFELVKFFKESKKFKEVCDMHF